MEHSFRLGARKVVATVASVALAASLCTIPMTASADQATSDTEAALAKLNELMSEIDSANADYQAALDEQAAAEQKVKEAKATIKDESAKITKNQEKLSSRVCSMYKDGQSTFLDVLLGSTTFDSFVQNWDLLSDMNDGDVKLLSDLKDSRDKLQKAQEKEQQNADKAAEKAKAAADRRDQANALAQEAQAEYQAAMLNAAQITNAGNVSPNGTQTTTVSPDQIANFDQGTGEVTLTNGQKAKVIGYDQATGNAIVDTAMQYVGGKYVYGAEDANHRTFDCSGLVQYVYGKNGINVGGHNDRAILNAGKVVSNPRPGDICWWNGHVAIYAGNGMMISADNEKNGITYRKVDKGAKYVRY